MRIRILRRPSMASIDGLKLDRFEPGFLYDVGTTLGILMLAEGWAEPVLDEQPALLVPLVEIASPVESRAAPSTSDTAPQDRPSNLVREFSRPYADLSGMAADFGRQHRHRRY